MALSPAELRPERDCLKKISRRKKNWSRVSDDCLTPRRADRLTVGRNITLTLMGSVAMASFIKTDYAIQNLIVGIHRHKYSMEITYAYNQFFKTKKSNRYKLL
jgi:hypothetical protein